VQEFRFSGVMFSFFHDFRSEDCRCCMSAGVRSSGVRSAGVQECRSAGVQELQELQELREAKIPLHRWIGNPGTA
jgi:uncharacterized protein (UPF0248 family)